MIAQGQLYVDLRNTPLAEPQRVHIFRDQETAQGYAAIYIILRGTILL